MTMTPIVKTLLIIAAVTIALWAVGMMVGYQMALLPSLAISIGLTVLLNLGRIKGALTRNTR